MTQPALNGVAVAPKKDLLRGTVIAAAVAGVILTVAVLPAEYGIDPTGIGKALGLTALNGPPAAPPAAGGAASGSAPTGSTVAAKGEQRALTIASSQPAAYRVDIEEITLAPGKGLEVKTHLAKGATLVYSWKTRNGELVNHDFHGEPVDAKRDEFESFIAAKGVSESRGSLIAPFTGLHGWYWKNKGTQPVTVVLHASGFYTEIFKK